MVIAGRAEVFWSVLAFAAGVGYERVMTWFQTRWVRISPSIVRLITVLVLLVGALFLLDAVWWFSTGWCFIPGWD